MAISDIQKQYIVGLTVGLFNGAPGANFLREFSNLIDAGMSFEALADFLVATPQFRQNILKGAVTNQEIAAALLKNFGLTTGNTDPASADAQAEKFVVDSLNAGRDIGDIIIEAGLYLLGTPAPEFADTANLFKNKILVAEIYSRENSDDNVGDLQAILAGVTAEGPANEADAVAYLAGLGIIIDGHTGETFTLTPGADTIVGTTGNDTINALSVDSNGAPATTFSAFDNIDGGAGTDILNIFTDAGLNDGFPANATVKNVETINYNNAALVIAPTIDAANFVGATAINQVGFATDVTNLAATTTAGFRNVAADVSVTPADAAATAAVALNNFGEDNTITFGATGTGILNAVTVSGTVKDTDGLDGVGATTVDVTVGKDVESLSVNTAVKTTLTVTDDAGTKKVSTVDASASTGDITYAAAPTVANVKTGAGNDTATIAFAGTATANAASLSTGAGNDTLTVSVTQGAATAVTAAVDAGEGDDQINLTNNTGVTYDVQGGAGNDTVTVLLGTGAGKLSINLGAGDDTFSVGSGAVISATDLIDAGEGTDTLLLSLVGAANVGAFSNFDVFDAAGKAGALDLDILVTKNTVSELITSGATGAAAALTNIGADVGFRATGDMVASSITLTQKTAGALTVTLDADQAAEADNDDAVSMAVVASNATSVSAVFDTAYANAAGTQTGEMAATDNVSTIALSGIAATLNVVSGGANANNVLTYNATDALTSATVSGDRALDLSFSGATKLATVDASAQTGGLTFDLADLANGGTVKLGSGTDVITVTSASTGGGVESISGLEKTAAVAVSTAPADVTAAAAAQATADVLVLAGASVANVNAGVTTGTIANGVLTFTGTGPTTLENAIGIADAAAETAGEAVVFEYLGNSYAFVQGTTDTVVQLTGITGVTNFAESGITADHFFIV